MNSTIDLFASMNFTSRIDYALYSIRSVFYLLKPSETYYDSPEKVPNLTKNAENVFFSFILVEQLLSLIKHRKFNGRLNDSITSLSAGIIFVLPNLLMRNVYLVTYEWFYDHFNVYELPWDNLLTYLVTLLFVDMMYYWLHRVAHEVNFFWAAHQTHHSSEDYNLTTALRQSIIHPFIRWIFYVPLAILVRPSVFFVHSHLNLISQFWIHTEIIDSMGPLEYILNTPSHHRVHHGRNPYCIDKNYAGVLIIWDRLFGTFEAEKKDEQLAYGLVHPIETFDPLYIQLFTFESMFKRVWLSKSWSERFGILFKGPGWQPGTSRLGDYSSLPKVENPIRKYNPHLKNFLNWYVAVQFLSLIIVYSEFTKRIHQFPTSVLILAIIFITYNLTCFGKIFDAKASCFLYESIRCLIMLTLNLIYSDVVKTLAYNSGLLRNLLLFVNFASFGLSSLMWLTNASPQPTKHVNLKAN